jgi:hypothetical protein
MSGPKTYTSPDGVIWKVVVQNPGSSNAMVVFRHPGGQSSRKDRYNWYLSKGPEARSVTSRLSTQKVLDSLDEGTLTQLFRRSMRVSRPDPLKAAMP